MLLGWTLDATYSRVAWVRHGLIVGDATLIVLHGLFCVVIWGIGDVRLVVGLLVSSSWLWEGGLLRRWIFVFDARPSLPIVPNQTQTSNISIT